MMENKLTVFTNEQFGKVRGIDFEGESWLVGKDVVEALGYDKKYYDVIKQHCDEEDYILYDSKTQHQNGVEFNYKELGQRGGYLINESGMYALVFGSELQSAKAFKKWVTSEVLPSIRKTGGYISEHATEEQLEQLSTMCDSIRSIKKQIRECDIMKLPELVEKIKADNIGKGKRDRVSKADKKLTTTEWKQKVIKTIILAIQERDMPTDAMNSVETAVRYTITDKLHNELLTINKRSSKQTIVHKEKENDLLREQLERYNPSAKKFTWVNHHLLSENYMYTYKEEIHRLVKSDTYKRWLANFPYNELMGKEEMSNKVDFTKPMGLVLKIVIKNEMDAQNMKKAIIDLIANQYGFNDVLIEECKVELIGRCQNYNQGSFGYYLYNL